MLGRFRRGSRCTADNLMVLCCSPRYNYNNALQRFHFSFKRKARFLHTRRNLAPTLSQSAMFSTITKREEKSEQQPLSQLIEDEEDKPKLTTDSITQLFKLSKPEWKWIGLSACTLMITSSVTLLLPYASGHVIDYTIITATGKSEDVTSPLVMASGLFGLSAVSGVGVYLRTIWLAKAGHRMVARLRQSLYRKILDQESEYFLQESTTTGDLLSRLTSDAQMIQSAVTIQAVAALRGMAMSIGAVTMLVYTSPQLALISVGTLPPIFILTRTMGRKLGREQKKVQELLGDATSLAEQSLTSINTVKQFTAEEYESNRYRNAIAKAHGKAVDIAHWQAQLETGAHITGNAAILGVLGYGGTLVLDGTISAGDLTGFVMYSLLLAGNLSGLTSVYSDWTRAVAASSRILEVLERRPQIQSKDEEFENENRYSDDNPLAEKDFDNDNENSSIAIAANSQLPLSATIDISGLSFRYPTRPDAMVLSDFNLSVAPGEVVALVGGSGSGKSTLGNLLTRLYDPTEELSSCSPIRINGRSIKDYTLNELRQMVGVVSQDPVLFRGTIRDNIRYGTWDHHKYFQHQSPISDEDVLDAARQAHVMEFALSFPEGLDTMVGPRGMQLSGGQRQRIALARVLAKKSAPIVILDEATSALDAQSEHLVQQALQKLFQQQRSHDQQGLPGKKTIISIAHRLSTIRHASRIAVIENGRVVQAGTFDQLQSNDGPFRELMKTQLVGHIES